MARAIIVVVLTSLIQLACVPYAYRSEVPAGIEDRVPEDLEVDSVEVLAIPIWWDDGDYRIVRAVIVPSTQLDALSKQVPRQWSYGVMDISGHGPGHTRFLSCIYLVFDTGRMMWAEYDTWDVTYNPRGGSEFHKRWMNVHVGTLGPQWRADLLRTLGVEESITVPDAMQNPNQLWFINAPSPERLDAYLREWKDSDLDMDQLRSSVYPALVRISLSDSERRLAKEFVASIPSRELPSDVWSHSPQHETADDIGTYGGGEPN